MVIISSIYEVAFRSYSPFSTEILKTVSSNIYRSKDQACLHPLRKTYITDDSKLLWLYHNT